MNTSFFNGGVGNLPQGLMVTLVPVLILWSIVWKGLGLWHSAGRKQGWWFIALLVINTFGILEIVYLLGFLKLKPRELFPRR